MAKMTADTLHKEHVKIYSKMCKKTISFIQRTDWKLQRMKDDAAYFKDVLEVIAGPINE